jgi:hypothetical protein
VAFVVVSLRDLRPAPFLPPGRSCWPRTPPSSTLFTNASALVTALLPKCGRAQAQGLQAKLERGRTIINDVGRKFGLSKRTLSSAGKQFKSARWMRRGAHTLQHVHALATPPDLLQQSCFVCCTMHVAGRSKQRPSFLVLMFLTTSVLERYPSSLTQTARSPQSLGNECRRFHTQTRALPLPQGATRSSAQQPCVALQLNLVCTVVNGNFCRAFPGYRCLSGYWYQRGSTVEKQLRPAAPPLRSQTRWHVCASGADEWCCGVAPAASPAVALTSSLSSPAWQCLRFDGISWFDAAAVARRRNSISLATNALADLPVAGCGFLSTTCPT